MALVLAMAMRLILIAIPMSTVSFLGLVSFPMPFIDTLAGYVDTRNAGGPNNVGPHDSKMANKMDPRVDSDLGKLNHYYW
jgi:hypothetical protein